MQSKKSVFGDVKAWATAYATGAFMFRASLYAPREVVFPSTDLGKAESEVHYQGYDLLPVVPKIEPPTLRGDFLALVKED